jgi:hypothetical protein
MPRLFDLPEGKVCPHDNLHAVPKISTKTIKEIPIITKPTRDHLGENAQQLTIDYKDWLTDATFWKETTDMTTKCGKCGVLVIDHQHP